MVYEFKLNTYSMQTSVIYYKYKTCFMELLNLHRYVSRYFVQHVYKRIYHCLQIGYKICGRMFSKQSRITLGLEETWRKTGNFSQTTRKHLRSLFYLDGFVSHFLARIHNYSIVYKTLRAFLKCIKNTLHQVTSYTIAQNNL